MYSPAASQFCTVLTKVPDNTPAFLFLKFPGEMLQHNIPAGPNVSEIGSTGGLILAYLTSFNSLADLGKMIKSQKNYSSD